MKHLSLVLIVAIFATAGGVSVVRAEDPSPSPGTSPEASASPAKKTRSKKAKKEEATTAATAAESPAADASASPAKKTRSKKEKKADTTAAASASPGTTSEIASPSPAKKTRSKKEKKAEATTAASPAAAATTTSAPSVTPPPPIDTAASTARRKTKTPVAASPTASPSKGVLGGLFGSKASPTPEAVARTAPAPGGGNGMVWVNTDSHVYHKEGSRYYGKTKKGKYMTEAEAVKEGDKPAKREIGEKKKTN